MDPVDQQGVAPEPSNKKLFVEWLQYHIALMHARPWLQIICCTLSKSRYRKFCIRYAKTTTGPQLCRPRWHQILTLQTFGRRGLKKATNCCRCKSRDRLCTDHSARHLGVVRARDPCGLRNSPDWHETTQSRLRRASHNPHKHGPSKDAFPNLAVISSMSYMSRAATTTSVHWPETLMVLMRAEGQQL